MSPFPAFHPLNRYPIQLAISADGQRLDPDSPLARTSPSASDSGASSAGSPPPTNSTCYCGKEVHSESGMYCSTDCARSDAFSSLCYKPEPSVDASKQAFDRSIIAALTRAACDQGRVGRYDRAFSKEDQVALSQARSELSPAGQLDMGDWNASHYRRITRADEVRREERDERRRRRRAEGSNGTPTRTMSSSSSSSSLSRVPDLVPSHSRNTSVASSISSNWSSSGGLSRNASSASTSSRRGCANGINVDDAIMEDDGEEFLTNDFDANGATSGVYDTRSRIPHRMTSKKRVKSNSAAVHDDVDMGMGRDMRDVLEEILSMEQSFHLDEDKSPSPPPSVASASAPSLAPPALVAPMIVRPPRTPSPMGDKLRDGQISFVPPAAPFAPARRISFGSQTRPPSMIGHQASLSESHTALYLATASPLAPSQQGKARRSASPNLSVRRSLTFTPQAAGPALHAPPRSRFDSPGLTPMRGRKHLTPTAHHPAMDGWRFPTSSSPAMSTPNAETPTRMLALDDADQRPILTSGVQWEDEVGGRMVVPRIQDQVRPQLLWPAPPPNLAPSLFPSSPAEYSDVTQMSFGGMSMPVPHSNGTNVLSPPRSGLRLGVLLGSGGDSYDADDDDDDDEEYGNSGARFEMDMDLGAGLRSNSYLGNGRNNGQLGPILEFPRPNRTFLPVYLEPEGFQTGGHNW